MGIISEANTNGTLQVTIPMKAARELGWVAGMTITPVLLSGKRADGAVVPFALAFHIPEGTNGVKLKRIGNMSPVETEPV